MKKTEREMHSNKMIGAAVSSRKMLKATKQDSLLIPMSLSVTFCRGEPKTNTKTMFVCLDLTVQVLIKCYLGKKFVSLAKKAKGHAFKRTK